jgi:SET domain-containing protein
MLTIKTKIKQSELHGIGLFADQDIPKGTIVWKFDRLIDRIYVPEEIEAMPTLTKNQMKHYGYQNDYGNYILCGDDARFFNHSTSANCFERYSPEGISPTIACKDIKRGEELTINYCQFDNAWKDKHIILTLKEKRELEKKGMLLDTERCIFPRMVKRV